MSTKKLSQGKTFPFKLLQAYVNMYFVLLSANVSTGEEMQNKENNFEIKNDIIEGRNAVVEALRVGRSIDKIFIAKGETDKTLGHIASKAREAGIVVVDADRRKLDNMSVTKAHQGVIALVGVNEYCEVADILALARERGEQPFIIVCDEVSDPRNLGAIIRSAECAGAHGVIITKHESVSLNSTVLKAAAGAAEYTPVARVTNLSKTADELRARGVWITGTAADADRTLFEADLTGPVAICIGSEGEGISRLLKEKCDFLVSIPMEGQTESLNASVAGALCMYEVLRTRKGLR